MFLHFSLYLLHSREICHAERACGTAATQSLNYHPSMNKFAKIRAEEEGNRPDSCASLFPDELLRWDGCRDFPGPTLTFWPISSSVATVLRMTSSSTILSFSLAWCSCSLGRRWGGGEAGPRIKKKNM